MSDTNIRTAIAALFTVLLVIVGCADKSVISKGDRVGIITKFSNKAHSDLGCSGKWAWEGEMSMLAGTKAAGQNVGDDGAPVSVWKFSLGINPDRALIEKIQRLMDSGHRARVTYAQWQNADSCEAESDYLAVDVADVDQPR
jgi:hypothetical protein